MGGNDSSPLASPTATCFALDDVGYFSFLFMPLEMEDLQVEVISVLMKITLHSRFFAYNFFFELILVAILTIWGL